MYLNITNAGEIEEHVHLKYTASDNTRKMQDSLITEMVTTMKNMSGKSL